MLYLQYSKIRAIKLSKQYRAPHDRNLNKYIRKK